MQMKKKKQKNFRTLVYVPLGGQKMVKFLKFFKKHQKIKKNTQLK